ncbi:MAG: FMN-binding protein [Spirochaetes bacterium]|nr:FMN-binding protein [Spirochaetota bacterium]
MKIGRQIIRPTLVLTAITVASVFLLSHVERLAGPIIIKRARQKQEAALSLVLPGYIVLSSRTIAVDGVEFTYWEAEKKVENRTVRAYAFLTKGTGYGGDMVMMAGVDEKGEVLGLSIISQSETPGLGDRCLEVADRETLWDHLKGGIPERDFSDATRIPWFQNQFKGLDANEKIQIVKRGDWEPGMRDGLLEINAISAITGATITSAGVVRGLESGLDRLRRAREAAAAEQTGGIR